MSELHTPHSQPGHEKEQAIDMVIVPRLRDLGDFQVARVLPAQERQMVGPFIFLDQMGPSLLQPSQAVDVRPHPHIGLITATWLFEGQIFHRDSLGYEQPVYPGALNWMTAGRGIVHSERSPLEERGQSRTLFGMQAWLALPKAKEEASPSFQHITQQELPVITDHGITLTVIAGSLYGKASPVPTVSPLFFGEVQLAAGAKIQIPTEHIDRALYLVQGNIKLNERHWAPGQLLVLKTGEAVVVQAITECRFMLLGGEPLEGPRYIWWNFVSSSQERITEAREDWRQARFPLIPHDQSEFIPLPN